MKTLNLATIELASRGYDIPYQHPGRWALNYDSCQFLGQLIKALSPRNVLEFGSGFSSVVIANELNKQNSGLLDSIDNSSLWSKEVEELAKKFGLKEKINFYIFKLGVRIYQNLPCVFYCIPKTFYNNGQLLYDLVVVDGPPHLVGRDGALPEAFNNLQLNGYVFLDDCNSGHMRKTLNRWQKMFSSAIEVNLFTEIGNGIGIIRKIGGLTTISNIKVNQWLEDWVRTLRNIARLKKVGF